MVRQKLTCKRVEELLDAAIKLTGADKNKVMRIANEISSQQPKPRIRP